MTPLRKITGAFLTLFRKRRLETAMAEEMRLHIEMKMEANLRVGMDREEARLAALKQFGWEESIKNECREQRSGRWVENVIQDLRFGTRILCKSPGFTAIAVLTLALGIGATTAIFSVVKTTLFDPLPVRDASDRYVQLVAVNKKQGWYGAGINAPALRDVQQQTNLFSHVAAYEFEELTLKGEDFLETVPGQRVTPEFFRLWTLRPRKGQVFTEDEAQPGRDDVMVISYQFWQKRLGGDPNVIGRAIGFEERTVTVIGVMPPFFVFPTAQCEFWRPFRDPQIPKGSIPQGAYEWLPNTGVIAEMRDGISRAQVQAFMDLVSKRQAQEAPSPNAEFDIWCREMIELFSTPELRRTLWILFGAVGFVLLIASANIANLQLARTERRQAELAVRSALGAGRARVFRQLFTENLLLACLGGLASVAVIHLGLELLQKLVSPELPRLKPVSLDAGVLWIAVGATLVTALLFGLLPAKLGIQSRLSEALKLGSTTTSRDRRSGRISSSLIICQVAVACVLLTGAGLMVRSVIRLLTVNPGFDPRNVVRVRPGMDFRSFLSADQDHAPEKFDAVLQDMQHRVAAIPGVVSAGREELKYLPIAVSTSVGGPTINLEEHFAGTGAANPLRTLRVPLVAGRWLDYGDAAESGPRILLNETAAHRLWPAENAVGKRLWFKRGEEDIACEVVGVVGDMRLNKYDEIPKPAVFLVAKAGVYGQSSYLVVRTTGSPVLLYRAIDRELKAAGAEYQTYFINLQEALYAATAGHRTLMEYLLVFASVGVFLAAIGLYGVLAYSAVRRSREIGIRMALGAKRREVLALVMAQGMRLLVVGLIVGLISALAFSRALRAFMFGITNYDALTLVSVAVLFSIIAGLASYLPARRAAKLEPMQALRCE